MNRVDMMHNTKEKTTNVVQAECLFAKKIEIHKKQTDSKLAIIKKKSIIS